MGIPDRNPVFSQECFGRLTKHGKIVWSEVNQTWLSVLEYSFKSLWIPVNTCESTRIRLTQHCFKLMNFSLTTQHKIPIVLNCSHFSLVIQHGFPLFGIIFVIDLKLSMCCMFFFCRLYVPYNATEMSWGSARCLLELKFGLELNKWKVQRRMRVGSGVQVRVIQFHNFE